MNSNSSSPLPPVDISGTATALQQAAVKEEALRRARFYRNATLGCLGAPALVIAVMIALMAYTGKFDLIPRDLCAGTFLVQFLVAPVFSVIFFSRWMEHRALAQRARPEASQRPLDEPELHRAIRQSRTAAERYGRWRPIAIGVGIVAAGAVLLAVIIYLPRGVLLSDWRWFSLLIILITGPASWLLTRRRRAWRRAGVQGLSARMNFRYIHRPVDVQLTNFLPLPLFRHGHRNQGAAVHFLHGTYQGRVITIMNYARQTVFVTQARRRYPDFRLWPGSRSAVGAVLQATHLGGFLERLNVTTEEARAGLEADRVEVPLSDLGAPSRLAAGYRLFTRADQASDLRSVPWEEVLRFQDAHGQNLVVEAAGGLLAVYQANHLWTVEEYPERMAEAVALCDLLEKTHTGGSPGALPQ
jgi:hypothetical protein